MKTEYISSSLLKNAFIGAANLLEKNKEMVNALNVFPVPDGDTGTNMSLTMQSAVRQLEGLKDDNIEEIVNKVSNGSLLGARGNSGVILSQLLRGFSNELKTYKKIDIRSVALAFNEGAKTAYKAVMKPIEGTILTVARECGEKAIELSKSETDLIEFLKKVIEYGESVLDKTPDMLPVLKEAGVVDAGGKGLIVILQGALQVLSGEGEVKYENNDTSNRMDFQKLNKSDEEIEFGYCTEFLINNNNKDSRDLSKDLGPLGDSMLVIDGDGFIKVHIHTNNPGTVLQKALEAGELLDIKIDNMRYQHSNNTIDETARDEVELKKYGFITISMGDGIKNIFEDLNVDHVISGGQTMNPSTEDILKAVDNIRAENIIILPNNSNIILAATQAKELSDKNIVVIPTKTIPQGIAALLGFDQDVELDENVENMSNAFKSIKTGQVTFSVRDTIINDIEIKKDDIIGICDNNITSVGKDINEVTLELIKDSLTEDSELITLFYGEGITEEEGQEVLNKLEDEYEDLDIELIYGGQPLYYYLIAIE